MPGTPINIDPFLPDGATYNLVINERMRRLLHASVNALIIAKMSGSERGVSTLEQQMDDEVLEGMLNMLDPESDDPLAPAPAVNGFVL